jgi:hypothetical protein
MKVNEVLLEEINVSVLYDIIKQALVDTAIMTFDDSLINEIYREDGILDEPEKLDPVVTKFVNKFLNIEYTASIRKQLVKIDVTSIRFGGITRDGEDKIMFYFLGGGTVLMLSISAETRDRVTLAVHNGLQGLAYRKNININQIIEQIIKTKEFKDFTRVQVHELTHLFQSFRLAKGKSKEEVTSVISKLLSDKSNFKRASKYGVQDTVHSHFSFNQELSAYVSEISAHIIDKFKKKEEDSFNTFLGLDVSMYIADAKKLTKSTLDSIPVVAKYVRPELNSYNGTKLQNTLYKQVAVSVYNFISAYVPKRINEFNKLQKEEQNENS